MYVGAMAVERSEGRAKRGDSRGVSRVPSGRDMVLFLEVLDGMVMRRAGAAVLWSRLTGSINGARSETQDSPCCQ